jgi:hypothetical protein
MPRKGRKVPVVLPSTQGSLIFPPWCGCTCKEVLARDKDILCYVPEGIVSGTRPTAKMNPSIHKDTIPIHMLAKFTQGMLPALKWERLISESIAESNK